MGLRINTNVNSMTAQRNLGAVTTRLQGNFSRLASGLRIATASDDAAGLAISERIVRDHSGSLEFESTPNKGTTVRVTFPLATNFSTEDTGTLP